MRTPKQAAERAKQLVEGVNYAATALRHRHPQVADAAMKAAARLGEGVVALAGILARSGGDSARPDVLANARLKEAETLVQRAVDLLHRLHFEIIRFDLEETPPETVPLKEADETAEAIQGILGTLGDVPGG